MYARVRAKNSDTPIKKYEYLIWKYEYFIKQYEYQNFHSDTRNKKYDWQIFHSASRINKSCQSKNQPTDSNGLMYASWLFLLRTRHKNIVSRVI